jgi:hypothetical protein
MYGVRRTRAPGGVVKFRSRSVVFDPHMAKTPTIESPVNRARKRLRRRRRGARLRLLLGVGLLAGGLTVFNVAQSHIDWLTTNGVQVSALVVGNDGPGCSGEDTPHVQVEFSTRSGHKVRDNLATGGTDCGSYTVGKRVVVYYNRASPTDAALGGGNADIGIAGWIGLGLLLYGFVEVGKWAFRSHGVRGALATVAHPSTEVGLTRLEKGRVELASSQIPALGDLHFVARGDSEEETAEQGLAYCDEFAPGHRVVVLADDFVIWGRLRGPKKA